MPVFVQIDLDAAQAAGELAEGLAGRLDDASRLMKVIGQHMVVTTDERFVDEEAPSGDDWAELSPATVAKKKKNKDRILQEQGRPEGLRANIAYQVTQNSVRIGANKPYAGVMQFGAEEGAFGETSAGQPIPFGDIPARPYVGASGEDREVIREMIRNFVVHGEV